MKKVIIGLLVLMFVGVDLFGQTYNIDEVVTPPTNEKEVIITYFKSSMEPVNGVVYCKYGNVCKYIDGKREGIYRQWYKNGQLMVEEGYKNGKPEGLHKAWHENGQLMAEGNFIDGKEHGIHRTWHKYDKQKKILFIYDRGELISRKCWSEQDVKYLLTNLNSDTLGIKF